MPGCKSNAVVSHSVSHRELAPPLALAKPHWGFVLRRARELLAKELIVQVHRNIPYLTHHESIFHRRRHKAGPS
jgi:hypothetical protein